MKRFIATICTAAAALSVAAAKPSALSLDYCADQYLLKLADQEQILAVSRGAGRDYSYMREAATPHRQIRASAEEALSLKPDIILRQWGGGARAEESFERFGAKVVSLGYAVNFDDVIDNIRLAADVLDQEARGEAVIRELETKLARLTETNTSIEALYVTPGGVTAGAQTMIDAIFNAAGVVNITARNGLAYWSQLPAEELLLDPPQLIVAGFFSAKDEEINYWSAARHPAIADQFRKTPTIDLSADLLSCPAWFSVEAAEAVAIAAKGAQDVR
ncbi:MAG: ABC transporter substrate-binding protein [Hyphococcus sp.]